MKTRIDKFWKIAGENRKRTLDSLKNSGVRLTPEDVLEETVNAVFDTTLIEFPKAKGNAQYEDFLHDIRRECFDVFYSRIAGVERNG